MTDMEQLGFDALLGEAETTNQKHKFDKRCGHLPASMREGLPYYRDLLERYHQAMMEAASGEVMRLREEAHDLALRLNHGQPGIIANDDSPGNVLTRETAAPPGIVPTWGRCGDFIIDVGTMKVRIELDGLFGICSSHCYWPGFAARTVEPDKPFLSGTGYRSFLGIHAEPLPGLTPDEFYARVIESYVTDSLKGKLPLIEDRWK